MNTSKDKLFAVITRNKFMEWEDGLSKYKVLLLKILLRRVSWLDAQAGFIYGVISSRQLSVKYLRRIVIILLLI